MGLVRFSACSLLRRRCAAASRRPASVASGPSGAPAAPAQPQPPHPAPGAPDASAAAAPTRGAAERLSWRALTWPTRVLWGGGLFTAVVVLLGTFRKLFEDGTAAQTAQAARKALADAQVRDEALFLARDVVEKILRSEDSVDRLVRLLRRLVEMDSTVDVVSELLRRLFDDVNTQQSTRVLAARVLEDDESLTLLAETLRRVSYLLLRDEELRDRAVLWVSAVARDTASDGEVLKQTGDAMYNVLLPWPLNRTPLPGSQAGGGEQEGPQERGGDEAALLKLNRELETELLGAYEEIAALRVRLASPD